MFNVGDFRLIKKDVYVHSLSLDLDISFANDIIIKIIEVSHKIFNGDTFVFGEIKELLYPYPGAKTEIINKPNSVVGFYISESEPFDIPLYDPSFKI